MSGLMIGVEGVGVWTPQATNLATVHAVLSGAEPGEAQAKPEASTLTPNERRRAPLSVLMAVEVAAQAVQASGYQAADLACVFASAFGDQVTTDYMCQTLADAPTTLSPTRFHNSVHNAAAGYWTIATGCHAPSTAICAGSASFGAGLLEAAAQACAQERAVLLVCSDTLGVGPLGELSGCRLSFASAWVISPASRTRGHRLRMTLTSEKTRHASLPHACLTWMRDNPSAACLPLLAILRQGHGDCVLALSEHTRLQLSMESLP